MKFPHETSKITLAGPVGALEAITTWPILHKPVAVAIVCHPHPLYQGTMHNKVITTLAKSFNDLGLATVRFNYRGVGASTGHYGEMLGEVDDLLAVKTWVQQALPGVPVWLAGFSFGSYIAASVANKHSDVAYLLSVAPAVHHADYQQLTSIACPWVVIQGEKDEIVSYNQVKAFTDNPPSQLRFISMPDATHFFHGQLTNLGQIVTSLFANDSQ